MRAGLAGRGPRRRLKTGCSMARLVLRGQAGVASFTAVPVLIVAAAEAVGESAQEGAA